MKGMNNMSKSKRRVQNNGRERGIEYSTGSHHETSPIARGQIHKGKQDMRNRESRRDKARGWE